MTLSKEKHDFYHAEGGGQGIYSSVSMKPSISRLCFLVGRPTLLSRLPVWKLAENMTIHELETAMNREFGLPARVYVRKDGYWLKSKTYDHIPLRQIGGSKQSVRIAG